MEIQERKTIVKQLVNLAIIGKKAEGLPTPATILNPFRPILPFRRTYPCLLGLTYGLLQVHNIYMRGAMQLHKDDARSRSELRRQIRTYPPQIHR